MKNNVTIVEDKTNNFLSLPIEEQRFIYYKNGINYPPRLSKLIYQYSENEEYIIISNTEKIIKAGKNGFYLKTIKDCKFGVNKKTKKTFCNCDLACIINIIAVGNRLKMPEFEWISKAREDCKLCSKFFTKSIIRDILLDKITNPEVLVKRYIKLNHYKNISWRVLVKYINIYDFISVQNIIDLFDNPDIIMKRIIKSCNTSKLKSLSETNVDDSDCIDMNIIQDMVGQALRLGITKKFNSKWSIKRFTEEHNKLTNIIMGMEISEKSDENIYNIDNMPKFSNKYDFKFLNNEKDVFKEGTYMHHCLYSSYYNSIKEKRYLAFAFNSPERFTLGLRFNPHKGVFDFDQAYLKYDKNINEESFKVIDDFLSDEENKDAFEFINKDSLNNMENKKNVEPFVLEF